MPAPLVAAIYLAGSYVCHQIPERTFHVWGIAVPVCARCTGLYLGALAGAVLGVSGRVPIAAPADRRRALTLGVMPTLVSIAIEQSGLWDPGNIGRAVAGVIAGGTVAAVVLATLHYERCAQRQLPAQALPPSLHSSASLRG